MTLIVEGSPCRFLLQVLPPVFVHIGTSGCWGRRFCSSSRHWLLCPIPQQSFTTTVDGAGTDRGEVGDRYVDLVGGRSRRLCLPPRQPRRSSRRRTIAREVVWQMIGQYAVAVGVPASRRTTCAEYARNCAEPLAGSWSRCNCFWGTRFSADNRAVSRHEAGLGASAQRCDQTKGRRADSALPPEPRHGSKNQSPAVSHSASCRTPARWRVNFRCSASWSRARWR